MLVAELSKQGILESLQRSILVAGNSQGCGLVAGCVDFDLMFQRIVVEIIYSKAKLDMILSPFVSPSSRTTLCGTQSRRGGGYDIRRLHSGTDSLSS